MAIINATPDSFSDGGQFQSLQHIVDYCGECLENGVDILDVGGESTRPGSLYIEVSEETDRVVPVIESMREAFPEAFISVDTRKSGVAKFAINAGALMVNDVSGGLFDQGMDDLVIESGVAYCIMHSQGTPDTMQDNPAYLDGVVEELKLFFKNRISELLEKGLPRENIIIDPGFGFGKTLDHNWELFNRMNEFLDFEVPVLAGISRKTFLTRGENILPADRDELTKEAVEQLLKKQVRFFRLHNTTLI